MKKKNPHRIAAFVLSLVMCITLLPIVAPTTSEASGYGSNGRFLAPIDMPASDSIPISSRTELDAIRNNLSGKYHLTADIDLSGAEWVPIGDNSGGSSPKRFSGVFDGQGHQIKNLTITGDGYKYNGLFGYVTSSGTIKNTGMEGTNINIKQSSGAAFSGAICAYSSGADISNCYNTGNLSTICTENYNSATGGICGLTEISTTNISYCYNTGRVSSSSCAGGICGQSLGNRSTTNIDGCFNTGNITAASIAGGICGNSTSSPTYITNCFNTGNITADSSQVTDKYTKTYVGGIGGYYAQIDKCYNAGDVSAAAPLAANAHLGGILGGGYYEPSSDTYWNIDKAQMINGANRNTDEKKGFGGYSETSQACATAQMKNAATFDGFDFSAIWDIDPAVNDGYPFLRNMPDLGGNPGANGEMLLSAASPASGSTNVLRSDYIELVFNQIISIIVESRVKLIKSSTSQPVAITVKQNADNPSALRIIPTSTLEANTRYHLEIDWNAIAAEGNEYFSGISGEHGYYFTTNDEINTSKIYYLDAGGNETSLSTHPLDHFLNEKVSTQYDPELSELAMAFSRSVYSESLIKKSLESHGFTVKDTDNYSGYNFLKPAYAIAERTAKNGRKYVAVVIRGTNSWGDVTSDAASLAGGFELAATELLTALRAFYPNDNNVTYFITGHSYGGAIAALIAGKLNQSVSENNLFAYTFAAPNTGLLSGMVFKDSNIFNIVNTADTVPNVPPKPLYWKLGTTYKFTASVTNIGNNHDGLTYLNFLQSHPTPNSKGYLDDSNSMGSFINYWVNGILCPVDVDILNSNGALLARFVNNQAEYMNGGENELTLYTIGEEKYFIFKANQKYTINLKGSDYGTMTFFVQEIDSVSDEAVAVTKFENVALLPGKQMRSEISGDIDAPGVKLFVMDEYENVVAEIDNDGTETEVRIPFTDVSKTAWYYGAVEYVFDCGLMTGTTATTFSPDTVLSRAMFATVLYRMEGEPSVTYSNIFSDVPSGQWYSSAIVWAYRNGIINGYGDGRFGTGDNITREQMMTILYNYAVFKGYDASSADSLSGFIDAGKISSWALEAVNWCVAAKIVNGTTETTLEPGSKSSRAQCATVLQKYLEKVRAS